VTNYSERRYIAGIWLSDDHLQGMISDVPTASTTGELSTIPAMETETHGPMFTLTISIVLFSLHSLTGGQDT
jgi:hypothetical protein